MKSWVLCALAALLFPLPASAAPSAAPSASPSPAASAPFEATLTNGMRVVIVRNLLAPVVTTSLVYGVGSYDDTIPGIAHATEHMMFRGTSDLSSDQFAEIATRIGAQYDAQTTTTYTCYYFTAPASYLDVVLRIEADRMQFASIRESDWRQERGAIEQEVQAHLGNPLLKALKPVNAVFFGDSAWGLDPVGTIAGFEKMHAADIAAFYHTWYHPNNATLIVVGDVDPQAALASVQRWFGDIASAKLPVHPPMPVAPIKASTLHETIDFPLPISIVAMRVPGTDSPDWAALQVLFAALDSGRSAFADLVLQGKALAAFAQANAQAGGGVATFASVTVPGGDPASGVDQLDAVIRNYAETGVPGDLVADAKQGLLASQDYEAASIPGEAGEWTISYGVLGRIPQRQYDALAAVTPADVDRVFDTYISGGPAVSAILAADPRAAMSKSAAGAAQDDVTVTAARDVPLPAWAAAYFNAPLAAPKIDDAATIVRLKNGMTVAVREEHTSPTFIVAGEIETNPDRYAPRGKEGVSQLTSSLLAFGTTTYDYKSYQAAVERLAAHIELGSTIYASAPSAQFDRTIALLAEGELHPAFPADHFAVIQADAVKATAALENRPEQKAALARLYAMYPPGDVHRRHATAKTFAAVTLDDVKRWYRFAYRPDLATFAVVGDVTPAEVKDAFDRCFGAWSAHGPVPPMGYPPVKAAPTRRKSVTIQSTTAKEADVVLTEPLAVRRGDSSLVALQIANTMLSGEGPGSLLYRDVRSSHGYVYSIDSAMAVSETGATFALTFASDPKNIGRAQKLALAAIQRLRQDPPTDEDVALAKAMLLSAYSVSLDSYTSVAGTLLVSTEDGIDAGELNRYYSQVIAVTPQQVMLAMRRWIDPARFVRVIVEPSK